MIIIINNQLKKAIKYRGSIARASKERVGTLKFHPSGRYLGCQVNIYIYI